MYGEAITVGLNWNRRDKCEAKYHTDHGDEQEHLNGLELEISASQIPLRHVVEKHQTPWILDNILRK
jgi:hypothetical protein